MIAYLSAGVLLIAQIVLYIKLDTRQDLFMADNLANPFMVKSNYVAIVSDRSNHGAKTNHRLETLWQLRQKLLIKFHITFPHIRCGELEVAHDDLSGDDFVKAYGKSVYTTRLPSRAEREKLRMHLEGGITREGCTIEGTLPVPKVGGMMSITVTKESWNRVANALSSLSMGLFTPQMEIGSIVKNLPNVR